MRSDGSVEIQYYVTPDDKQRIDEIARETAKGNLSDFTRRAIAYYMEHGLEARPISAKSRKGGKRDGAGRKPSTKAS